MHVLYLLVDPVYFDILLPVPAEVAGVFFAGVGLYIVYRGIKFFTSLFTG